MRITYQIMACIVALAASGAAAADTRTFDKQVDADARGVVEISNTSGRVEVSGWDKPQVSVHGELGGGVERVDVTSEPGRTLIKVLRARALLGRRRGEPARADSQGERAAPVHRQRRCERQRGTRRAAAHRGERQPHHRDRRRRPRAEERERGRQGPRSWPERAPVRLLGERRCASGARRRAIWRCPPSAARWQCRSTRRTRCAPAPPPGTCASRASSPAMPPSRPPR